MPTPKPNYVYLTFSKWFVVSEIERWVKEELQKLSDELNIEIRIAHYPPYTSKYNPIEHRLFPHITKACQGVIFKSVELVNDLIAKTQTSTGLKVVTNILNKTFETGRKVASDFKENMRIQFDEYLPEWNYVAIPDNGVVSDVIKSWVLITWLFELKLYAEFFY